MSENLKECAYLHIYQKLADGELAPGSRLSNRGLAKEIGISPIPVREAISQLQSEGLVEHRRGMGAFVPEPSSDELEDLYDQREALECHAIGRICGHFSDADLAEMVACIAEFSAIIEKLEQAGRATWDENLRERWRLADAAFHDTLLRAAGNRRTLRTVANLRVISRVFGKHVAHSPTAYLRRTLGEHHRILDALRRGDAEEARAAVAEHIRNGCRSVLQFYRRRRADKASSARPNLFQTEAQPGI